MGRSRVHWLLQWGLPVVVFVASFVMIRGATTRSMKTAVSVDAALSGRRWIDLGVVTADPEARPPVATFDLTWNGPADLTLTRIVTSCECTQPKRDLPYTVSPGQSLQLPVTIDWRGRTGRQESTIILHLTAADGTEVQLGLKVLGELRPSLWGE